MFLREVNLKLYFSLVLIIIALLLSPKARGEELPASFNSEATDSKLTINYDQLSQILNAAIFEVGRSYREKIPLAKPSVGTRLKLSRNRHSALETNRFDFATFAESESNLLILDKVKSGLESIPGKYPLNTMNRNEQLAYWLNLYNISLIQQLVPLANNRHLGDELYGNQSILDKKIISVSGVLLSLNQIQFDIIYPNFDYNPVLMYGFFQGVIGGPNIRKVAYNGSQVFQQLADNAADFINSNRGIRGGDQKEIRVSSLYNKNRLLFPDFNRDLKAHLLNYVNANYKNKVANASAFEANLKDMRIADILGGGDRKFGGSASTNHAALEGVPVKGKLLNNTNSPLTSESLDTLMRLKINSTRRRGQVIITQENSNDSEVVSENKKNDSEN